MDKLIGTIYRYLFHNEQNSYSVALLKTSKGTMTIVGYFPKLSSDFEYEFSGEYVVDKKYGEQLKVETFRRVEFENAKGLISYLSSNLFTGIGEKTATKIVDHLGTDAINRIIQDKKVLLEKEIGFTMVKAERLYQELLENQNRETTLVELYNYGITPKMAYKMINKYGLFTIDVLNRNPYQLIEDIEGVGFLKADEIAKKLDIADDDPRRLEAAVLYSLGLMCNQGGNTFVYEDDLLQFTKRQLRLEVDLQDYLSILIADKKITKESNRIYLSSLYYVECSFASKINELLAREEEPFDTGLDSYIEQIEKMNKMHYTDVQKEAVKMALNNKLSIITGGPGTGKTTIISLLLDIYTKINHLNKEEATYNISLSAPTGRAAKRMKEVLDFDARTIHSTLGYNFDGTFRYDKENKLPHKLIIIDEFSMVDIYLAYNLFEAISENAKIVIVGDVDQLPSVGPGQVLSDLINSKKIPTIKLNVIHRQAGDSKIIDLAYRINNQTLNSFDLDSNDELAIIRSKSIDMAEYIKNLVKQALDLGLDLYEDIQVLIPQYKGLSGIDKINEVLQSEFINKTNDFMVKGEISFYPGDKVIQLENDPKRQIMNGDIGYVKSVNIDTNNEKYLIVSFDKKEVVYYKGDLDDLNLAYAISIHKSQGSEYLFVILPIEPSYKFMLKKELIYTAVTRSKKYLTILGDASLLVYASNNFSEKRNTSLERRIG